MFLGIVSNGSHRITICSPDVPSHVKVFRPIEVVLEVIPNGLGTRRITVKLVTLRRGILGLFGVEAISKTDATTVRGLVPVQDVIWKVKRVEA